MKIVGNMGGCYSPMGKTFILQDENGNEITGVVVDQEQIFTATDNDVRKGMIYASDAGVSTGTKDIPAYHTSEGYKVIAAGKPVKITGLNNYEYTKLQAMICSFNSSASNSVAVEKVSLNNNIYAPGDTTVLATVTVDTDNETIDFGIVNEGTTPLIVRYFMYKEIY